MRPDSNKSLGVELGFNVLSVEVGDELDFTSDGSGFLTILFLEFQGFLSVEVLEIREACLELRIWILFRHT